MALVYLMASRKGEVQYIILLRVNDSNNGNNIKIMTLVSI